MVEIFDGVLQFLEHVLLPLAVPRNVGDRPHRVFRLALGSAERAYPHPQPAAVGAIGAGDADFFLLAFSFARRFQQAEHRLRHIGVADEHPLDRAGILRRRRPRQRQIGGVAVDHVAAGIGDREAVEGVIGNRAHDRIVRDAVGETDDAGRKREQVEQPDHRQQRQQAQDIRLRLRPAERHERHRGGDDGARDQQHQHDAAAAPRRLMRGHRRRLQVVVRIGGHRGLWPLARVNARTR